MRDYRLRGFGFRGPDFGGRGPGLRAAAAWALECEGAERSQLGRQGVQFQRVGRRVARQAAEAGVGGVRPGGAASP